MVTEIELKCEFKAGKLNFPDIPVFAYERSVEEELRSGTVTARELLNLLEQMLTARCIEEMIDEIKAGAYTPLQGFDYIGPTHLSIGQEATSVGSISALEPHDYITSSHRGHSDAVAKGFSYIKKLNEKELSQYLRERKSWLASIDEGFNQADDRETKEQKALRLHIYRIIAELFGKKDGYCGGIGGSMHIADFSTGHLGANAIVGGHMAIATGAGISCRYRSSDSVVLCLAGDGAYNNGIAHESMNMASMAQFVNGLLGRKFGIPVIYAVVNNQYGMSGQLSGEITGVDYIARRSAGYNSENMHSEVVNGMDVLAVRDATTRALEKARSGKGPILVEFITYRFKGHSLSDPTLYRSKDEVKNWKRCDPVETFLGKLKKVTLKDKPLITGEEFVRLKEKVWQRNAEMARKALDSEDPDPAILMRNMYSDTVSDSVPGEFRKVTFLKKGEKIQRDREGMINFRLAIREGLIEEMRRDRRVLMFGEDICEYHGAFGVTGDLFEIFGRERVFNTAISESAIAGAACGMAMTGLRPICEIMYCDFILMAMDQIGNQLAKWQFMSNRQVKMPVVIKSSIGGGRGYAGQHSQSLEAVPAHIPGLKIVAPWDPYDAKGLIKSATRDDNPVIYFEHQLLYNKKGPVPEDEFLVPIGKAKIRREGSDLTMVSWSYCVGVCMEAAGALKDEGIEAEVIDLRTLIPWDEETVLSSVRKTGRCIVVSQAVSQGSYTGEIASSIQAKAFDYLDSPVMRIGAMNCVSPSSVALEKIYMPDASKIVSTAKSIL